MANNRRTFGSVRKLPSGRYQARYRHLDGTMKSAPHTFARKEEATRWLTLTEAQMLRNEWIDPALGKIQLKDYAQRWIAERPKLRPRTVELYELLLRRHIAPYLGEVEIGKLTAPMVRTWRAKLVETSSLSMAAKAYRLLRAVLNTAVKEDELIKSNPCRIPGADQEHSEERPILTVPQVLKLVDSVPERYRALLLLSTFASLRWGEATALLRADLDLSERTVRITKSHSEVTGKPLSVGPVKSRAGRRTVNFPAFIVPALSEHLEKFTAPEQESLVFTGARGGALRRSNFRGATRWAETCEALGFPELHFHDLRHTGNTLASKTGTSLKDLMSRMGHDSPRAALIYQHATSDADQAIASALDLLLTGFGPVEPEAADDDQDDDDDGSAEAATAR